MGLLDFVKEAGEKLFGRGQAQAAMAELKAAPQDEAKIAAANAAAGDAILAIEPAVDGQRHASLIEQR